MSADLNEIKTKIENLISLKGLDIEIVGPDLLNDIDELFDDLRDQIDDLELQVDDLESDSKKHADNDKGEPYCDIETGRDTIKIWMDKGNLQDTQVIDALQKCYEANVNPITIMKVLDGLAR